MRPPSSASVGLARGLFLSQHAGSTVQMCQLWGEKDLLAFLLALLLDASLHVLLLFVLPNVCVLGCDREREGERECV